MPQVVRDIMTANPTSVPAMASVAEAARKMRDLDIGCLLVEDSGTLAGLVTDRDLVVRVLAEDMDPSATPVERISSKVLATLAPDDDVNRAIVLMRETAIRRIPVVQDGRAVGIVSIGDLAMERDPDSALAQISAAPPNR